MIEQGTVAKRPIGLLVIVSIFIFVVIVLISGGVYFYKNMLTTNLTQMQSDLEKAKNRFEPSKINELKLLDKRLQSSTEILSNHVIISPIFEALQAITLRQFVTLNLVMIWQVVK